MFGRYKERLLRRRIVFVSSLKKHRCRTLLMNVSSFRTQAKSCQSVHTSASICFILRTITYVTTRTFWARIFSVCRLFVLRDRNEEFRHFYTWTIRNRKMCFTHYLLFSSLSVHLPPPPPPRRRRRATTRRRRRRRQQQQQQQHINVLCYLN